METLTKENFWDAIEKKYPGAFKIFSDWIDQYKREVKWEGMFNAYDGCQTDAGHPLTPPKFHDLPWEFQTGVLARFQIECLHSDPSGPW